VKLGSRWAIRLSVLRAKWWSEERKAFSGDDQELLVKIHILLSAMLPLLVAVCTDDLDPGTNAQLAHGVDEATGLIEQLLQIRRV
jgi:hypothetical protein